MDKKEKSSDSRKEDIGYKSIYGKNMLLDILSMAHYQLTVYHQFLIVCNGNAKEAEKQTTIHMTALMRSSQGKTD